MGYEMENVAPNKELLKRRMGFRFDRIQEITNLQTIMSEIAALNEEAFDVLDSPLAKSVADRPDGFHALIVSALKQLAASQKLKLNYEKPKRAKELPGDRLHFIMEEINLLANRGVNLLPDDEAKNVAVKHDGWYMLIKIALGPSYHNEHTDSGASASGPGSLMILEVEMQRFVRENKERYKKEFEERDAQQPRNPYVANGYQPSSW